MANDPPPIRPDDHMHAVAPQPRALVEAILRTARSANLADEIEDCALRWRATGREAKQDGLANRRVSKVPHLSRHT